MKKKRILLLMILTVISCFNIEVFAKEEGFYADESLTLKESINRTMFAAGNNVNISSKVDGMSFVAGNVINLESSQDYLFVAGNSINLKNVRAKDAFVAGSVISINSSNIRDLYAAAQTITIDSDISRNAYLAGEKVVINGVIAKDIYVDAENIVLDDNAKILGTLINISKTAVVSNKKTYKAKDVKKDINVTPMTLVITKITSMIYSYISLLIVALLLMKFIPKIFKNIESEKKDMSNVLKLVLKGFLTLILVPIIAIMLLCTVVGIPLTIISLIIYGLIIYLSSVATAYYFGNWFLKDKIKNEYLLLVVSLLILYIVKIIPIIGGLVGFISLLFGMGIYMNIIKKK